MAGRCVCPTSPTGVFWRARRERERAALADEIDDGGGVSDAASPWMAAVTAIRDGAVGVR